MAKVSSCNENISNRAFQFANECKPNEENDHEYVPLVEGEDSDEGSDEDSELLAAKLSEESMPGDYEIEDLEGNITVVKGLANDRGRSEDK